MLIAYGSESLLDQHYFNLSGENKTLVGEFNKKVNSEDNLSIKCDISAINSPLFIKISWIEEADVCLQNEWPTGVCKHGRLYLSAVSLPIWCHQSTLSELPNRVFACVCNLSWNSRCIAGYEKQMHRVSLSSRWFSTNATQQSHSLNWLRRNLMQLSDALKCCLQWGHTLHQL